MFRPSPQNLCLRNRILLQKHVANNQIRPLSSLETPAEAPPYNTKRPLRRREKSDGIYVTCCGDKKKFSSTHEAICRCHASLAWVASISAWKDRGTGFWKDRDGTTANFRTVFDSRSENARKRCLRRLCGDATCCQVSTR